jgi:hypothetical protein
MQWKGGIRQQCERVGEFVVSGIVILHHLRPDIRARPAGLVEAAGAAMGIF